MRVTSRVLPREEWDRLAGTELAPILAGIVPGIEIEVVVVEHDDVIVGRWLLVPMLHVEGLWIDPAYRRRASVARRLWTAMRHAVQARGAASVLTGAITDDIRALLAHAGAVPLPDQYALPMGER